MNYFSLGLFLLFLNSSAFCQSAPIPFAMYTFDDGTFKDETGQVNGSELGNVLPATDRFGNPDHAVLFTDSSAISLDDNFDIFSTPDAAFSFSLWIKNEDLSTTNLLFLSKYGNSNCDENQREFFIRINDDRKIEFLFYSDIGSAVFNGFETNEEFFDTCWHHVVVNYDGSIDTNNGLDRVEIFVDGQKRTVQKSSNQSGNATDIQNSSSHLSLGTPVNSMGGICFFNTFLGKMDDVAFFDKTLSNLEVDMLYKAPSPTGNQSIFNAQFSVSDIRICSNECIEITDQSASGACEQTSDWAYIGADLTTGTPNAPQSICYPEAGSFQIIHILGNDYLKDTFVQNITVIDIKQDLLGQDTILCEGQTIELSTSIQAEAYLWSDGGTGSSIIIEKPGLFWLEATVNDCTVRDSIDISLLELPSPDLGPDQSICEGESFILDGTTPSADSYLWQDGSMTPEYIITQPGTYTLEVFNQCGVEKDEIIVSEKGQILSVNLGNDRLLCEKDTIRLDAATPDALTYRWNTGDTTPSLLITTPNIYQVTVSNDCFEATDEIIITRGPCCNVFVPNVFSPNNDDINDEFRIQTNCSILSFQMKIFNRWGGLVFESSDPNQGWNGRNQNDPLPKGVYTWFIRYDDGSGEEIKSGTVALIR